MAIIPFDRPQPKILRCMQTLPLCVTQSYWRRNFHTAGMRICHDRQVSDTSVLDGCGPFFCFCDLDLDPMTFIYEAMTRIPWSYTGCANMNFVRQGFRKLSSVSETEKQTESTEIINHSASRLVNNDVPHTDARPPPEPSLG